MPLVLAKRSKAEAHSRTCVMLPGELSTSEVEMVGALFAAHIKDVAVLHAQDGLQREGAFANAGLAAQKHDATRHQSAAQHAVELVILHVDAWLVLRRNFV